MKLPAFVTDMLMPRLQPGLNRLEAIPSRDRAALVGCALALIIGVEFMVIGPMAKKRQAVAAAGAQEAQAAKDTAASELAAAQEQIQSLRTRVQQAEAENLGSGIAKAQSEPVSALLQRALQSQAVTTVSLRSLASETLQPDVPDPASAPSPAVAAAQGHPAPAAAHGHPVAGAAPPSTARTLYRHRYELVLTGEAAALSASAGALEVGLAPLRVERVLLTAGKAESLQMTVTFGLTGTERAWLSL